MAKKEVKVKGHGEAMTCFLRYLEVSEYLDMGAGAYPLLNDTFHRRRSRSMAGPISKKCTSTTSCLPQTSGFITIAD